jgi:hypothetical protein
MKKEAAILLYQLGLMHDRLDILRERYKKDNRPESIQLAIELFKVKIDKLRKQLSELD